VVHRDALAPGIGADAVGYLLDLGDTLVAAFGAMSWHRSVLIEVSVRASSVSISGG